MHRRSLIAASFLAAVSLVAPAAVRAESIEDVATPVPAAPGPSTTVVAPPGSPGLTVVAPTAGGGTVTATGCSTVIVDGHPTLVAPGGAPCPTYAPYQPYDPYYRAPRYARDPDRSASMIGSAIVFGVGGFVTGIAYLVQYASDGDRCSTYTFDSATGTSGYTRNESACNHNSARTSLWTYGAIMTFTPSIPRWVMGDTTRGLVYTALRGGSFLAATLIDWGKDDTSRFTGPFLLAFTVPLALGIVDLVTTPHREDLQERDKAGLTGIAPVALHDARLGTHGALLAVDGRF